MTRDSVMSGTSGSHIMYIKLVYFTRKKKQIHIAMCRVLVRLKHFPKYSDLIMESKCVCFRKCQVQPVTAVTSTCIWVY